MAPQVDGDECIPDPRNSEHCLESATTKDVQPATTNVDQPQPEPTGIEVEPTQTRDGAKPDTNTSAKVVILSTAATQATGTVISTSSSLPAVNSSEGGSNGVSKGAVAGIAIATAIIGAAIAFLVAFVLFKRRNKQPTRMSPYDSTPNLSSYAKGGGGHNSYVQVSQTPLPAPTPVAAASIPPPRRDLNLEDLSNSSDFLAGVLPHAADEQTVKSRVGGLLNSIQHHVEHYYRDVHANITQSMETDIARFSNGDVAIVEMLQNSSMPTVAIKHALVGYILNITGPEQDGETLFPTAIAGIKSKEQFNETSDLSAAYILYKRLAVYLHSSAPPVDSSLQSDIREAAEHFAITFFPWANPTFSDQEKEGELAQIINSALELSIWLYGQPFLYEYVWEGVGRRGTIVAPGLTKVSDSKGRVGERPQMLLDPIVVST